MLPELSGKALLQVLILDWLKLWVATPERSEDQWNNQDHICATRCKSARLFFILSSVQIGLMLNQNLYATLSLALVIFGGGPVPSADARETGGLAAHYYNERDLDTTSRVKIVHEGVEIPDFQWTKDNLPPHGRKLFFSVRWLGSIQAPEPGEYQFEVMADDGARLVLDGNLLIDSWFTQAGSTATSEPVTLQEGSWTDILLEYRQMLGDGAIQLRWKTPGSREFTVVPGEHLSPQPPPSPWRVSAVRFMPASGKAATMKGGRFTGSNMSATNGFEEIATIREEPGEGWNELPVENAELYRWIKYEGPQGSHGQIAELRFLHEDRALSGEPFGTAGPGTEPWNAAFDDNPQTAYSGDDPDDQYAGIDLGPEAQTATPTADPAAGDFEEGPVYVNLQGAPGAYVRYTTDGRDPNLLTGLLAVEPVSLSETTTITARAFSGEKAVSQPLIATYRIAEKPKEPGKKVFYTGNSLLGGIVRFLDSIAESAGYDHQHWDVGAPGAFTSMLLNNQREKIEKITKERAPLDVYSNQPFNRSMSNEVQASSEVFEIVREHSPEAKMLIYMQWFNQYDPERDRSRIALGDLSVLTEPIELREGEELNKDDPEKAFIAKPGHWTGSWEEEMQAYLRYYEILHSQMKSQHPDRPIAVIPVGVGLLKLRAAVEAGDYPGLPAGSDYFDNFHMDSLHQNYSGGYFAALIHFASIYGVDPTGKVTSAATGLNPEQAEFLQKLAWETVREYPLSPVNVFK